MASFPTAVFSPASKSNGQTIDPAHVNDLDNEMVAVQSGLLNGTARLNSSHSTLAALSVSGGSTLADVTVTNLNVTGGSTFASRPVLTPPDAVKVTLESAASSTNNSTLSLNWTEQAFAVNSSMHSTATNPSRLFPQSTGVYRVDLAVVWTAAFAASTGRGTIAILDSSNGVLFEAAGPGPIGSGLSQSISGLKRFDAVGSTQYLRAVALVVDDSTHGISTRSTFSLVKL